LAFRKKGGTTEEKRSIEFVQKPDRYRGAMEGLRDDLGDCGTEASNLQETSRSTGEFPPLFTIVISRPLDMPVDEEPHLHPHILRKEYNGQPNKAEKDEKTLDGDEGDRFKNRNDLYRNSNNNEVNSHHEDGDRLIDEPIGEVDIHIEILESEKGDRDQEATDDKGSSIEQIQGRMEGRKEDSLAGSVNSRSEDGSKAQNQKFDPPSITPCGRAKGPLKVHQNEERTDQENEGEEKSGPSQSDG